MTLDRQGVAASLAVSALCMLALAAIPARADAVQRVADGDFEQTTCNASTCTSPAWIPKGSVAGGALIGPLCGPAETDCAYFGGNGWSGYHSPTHWGAVGSAYGFEQAGDRFLVSSSIRQDVVIPAAPATLWFLLFIHDGPYADETLTVKLDGQPLLTVTDNVCCSSYSLFSVPVGGFAGPGAKTLTFEAEGEVETNACPACVDDAESDFFQIDDVTLDAPDAPGAQATGQRAAALQKCKRKRGKAKKKCKRKALQLPV